MQKTLFILLPFIWACQQPFGSDRHDLEAFRVLALTTSPQGALPGDVITPSAHFVVEDRLWSDAVVEQFWFWVDETAPEDILSLLPEDAIATGARPTLVRPSRDVALALIAIAADGSERRALVRVPSVRSETGKTGELLLFSTQRSVSEQTPEDLTIESRQAWDVVATDYVPHGEMARFEVYHTDEEVRPHQVRWMATGPFGSFFETTTTSTDWAPATISIEDEELVVSEMLEPGVRTLAALLLDLDAPRGVLYREVWIDAPTTGAWLDGRWVPTDLPLSAGEHYEIQFAADDEAPMGLRVQNATSINSSELPENDPYGTEQLVCETPVSGPFSFDWLSQGWCLRHQLVDPSIVIAVQ